MWPGGEEQIVKNVYESMQNLDDEHVRQIIAYQSEMLRRKYPDYTEKDVVLWLVMDIFNPDGQNQNIHAVITLLDHEGKEIPLDGKYIVRFPYFNKCIHHIGFQNGSRRGFGYPIRFADIYALLEVSTIIVAWFFASGDEFPFLKTQFNIEHIMYSAATPPKYSLYRYYPAFLASQRSESLVLTSGKWFGIWPTTQFEYKGK